MLDATAPSIIYLVKHILKYWPLYKDFPQRLTFETFMAVLGGERPLVQPAPLAPESGWVCRLQKVGVPADCLPVPSAPPPAARRDRGGWARLRGRAPPVPPPPWPAPVVGTVAVDLSVDRVSVQGEVLLPQFPPRPRPVATPTGRASVI